MYLVHASLCGPPGAHLPDTVAESTLALALPHERVEHVVAHPHARPHPVLGVFLLADGLTQAEERTAELCRRAIRTCAGLGEWRLVKAEVPLLDRHALLPAPGVD
ncbi:hypothetical protein GCM10010218_62000 [Streptomyces mashuensis]|uniref:Uncharacterized protein n=1 Tax=Streptomyces mashuensis TaxID=33904 RepID=A0A919EGJ3_9ACTN|nr:hypothetical protein [Streptomyces mashuensis]GHF72303.1 hypothetical protein GCM10010218_62000 [Streptomyces mashuensis]